MSPPDFKNMRDDQLETIIANQPAGGPDANSASHELQRRRLEKATQKISTPHWTLIPAFWVLVATMIFAAIAAYPVIRDWFQFSPPVSKAASSPQQQSQPTEPSQPESKKPPSAPVQAKP